MRTHQVELEQRTLKNRDTGVRANKGKIHEHLT